MDALLVVATVGAEVASFHGLRPTIAPYLAIRLEAVVVAVREARGKRAGSERTTGWHHGNTLRCVSTPLKGLIASAVSSFVALELSITDQLET